VRVIVTRPAAQAQEWVQRLRGRGLDAVALPLICIAPVADPSALRRAWQTLAMRRLVVFVSPNAVRQFFAHRPALAAWPAPLWAASPGPGTTHELLTLGVPAARVVAPDPQAAQVDSEALWAQLQARDWRDAGVLIVRGDGGRDWLARTLQGQGAVVEHVTAYQRSVPQLQPAEIELARAAWAEPASHAWLFSSAEAVDNLATSLPWPARPPAGALAVVTHPRIGERARQAGFDRVLASRPLFEDMVACIQSIEP